MKDAFIVLDNEPNFLPGLKVPEMLYSLFLLLDKIFDTQNLKEEKYIWFTVSEDLVHGHLSSRQKYHVGRARWNKDA